MTPRHEQCAEILLRIYKAWDIGRLPQSVRVRHWDIFISRVKSAAYQSTTLRQFVEKLTRMLDIAALTDYSLLGYLHDDDECLQLLRDEAKIIVLLMRQKLHEQKEDGKNAKTQRSH